MTGKVLGRDHDHAREKQPVRRVHRALEDGECPGQRRGAQGSAHHLLAQFPPILALDHLRQPTRTCRGVSEQRVRPRTRRVIAVLYSRRWEEEKCFDTWKNDFSLANAWGASVPAIENQVRLAIVTSLLVGRVVHGRMGQHRIEDEKALRKQERRQTSATDGTDRPDWSTPIFRYTSKVSRQVLRFFKFCFPRPASQALYEAQLRPLLLAYL
jgi:hypothetical protein